MLVIPIGGADMPVVVALLNSYSGLASCATGFAIGNVILIISGALDGASGFILSLLMSKAMNRSFTNVLFGAFGGELAVTSGKTSAGLSVRSVSVEGRGDSARVCAVGHRDSRIRHGGRPGPARGARDVGAHRKARRRGEICSAPCRPMPGHMNVLLAEATSRMTSCMTWTRSTATSTADVALVIGANDVVNPAARNDKNSPIYGMPILDADHAKSVIVLKRGMAGFAGIENELFYDRRTSMPSETPRRR
jgi:NAD(P) transhydrogenase subunit beta